MRGTRASPQQAEIVVDLGDRADGRAGIRAGGLLLDGNRRREALDGIDIGLVHETEELPRISGERFDVATLPLSVDRVECQRRLARSGQPRDNDQGVPGQLDVDVLEIVFACSANDEGVTRHRPVA